jgi:hypothetical protein
MARGGSGFAAAGRLFGWGLSKGTRLGLSAATSPYRLAKKSGGDVLAGGGNVLQMVVAVAVWAFYGIAALYLAALLRNTGIVVLEPVRWALVSAGIVLLATLLAYFKTRGIQRQAKLNRALITIERNTSQTAQRMDKVEQAVRSGAHEGGGFTLGGAFRRGRHESQQDRVAREQAEQVREWTGGDPPGMDPIIPRFWRRNRRQEP